MKSILLERRIFILLYKFFIISNSLFVNIWVKRFFFLRLQLNVLKFINVSSRNQKEKFDKVGVFNGFLFFQELFLNFFGCKYLLFSLFIDFIFISSFRFVKKDFEIIFNFLIFLYKYQGVKDLSKFLYLFKDFLDLYFIYGEEVIFKFLTNLRFFGKLKLVKNFIDLVLKFSQKKSINLEIKFVLYKALNRLDSFMQKGENKTNLAKNLFKNKFLLLSLNLYFFWFLFYLERFVFVFSKFVFLLWVFIAKRFFLEVNLIFLTCNVTYFSSFANNITLNEFFLFSINLNGYFYNKNIILFTYKFITLQNYFVRWYIKRRRKKKVTRFSSLKILKLHSLA
jgi:hypothetical protein